MPWTVPWARWARGPWQVSSPTYARTTRSSTSILAVTLGLLLTLLLLWSVPHWWPAPPRHVLIIDAGSSGTRLTAWTWRPHAWLGSPSLNAIPPDAAPHAIPRRALDARRAYSRVETEPGLDAYAQDPEGLASSALGPLLKWAQEALPRSSWAATPVLLLGTAGVRRLPAAEQAALLRGARQALHASPFYFEDGWARVVSGEEEGAYGWVALNRAAGRIPAAMEALALAGEGEGEGEASEASPSACLGGGEDGGAEIWQTLGSLDLGGSSLQVCYQPYARGGLGAQEALGDSGRRLSKASEAALPPPFMLQLAVGPCRFHVFCHVHQGYGLNDAFDRGVGVLLLESEQEAGRKKDGERRKSEDRVAREVVRGETNRRRRTLAEANDQGKVIPPPEARSDVQSDEAPPPALRHPCLQRGYEATYVRLRSSGAGDARVPSSVRLLGAPDAARCATLARAVAGSADDECGQPPCALGVPHPRLRAQQFAATTGFFVVYHFFALAPSRGWAELRVATEAFCQADWADVAARRAGEVFLEEYCFRGLYVLELLERGLGLSLGPPAPTARVHAAGAGWTSGVALQEGPRAWEAARRGSQGGVRGALASGRARALHAFLWRALLVAGGVCLAALVLRAAPWVASRTAGAPALTVRARSLRALEVQLPGAGENLDDRQREPQRLLLSRERPAPPPAPVSPPSVGTASALRLNRSQTYNRRMASLSADSVAPL